MPFKEGDVADIVQVDRRLQLGGFRELLRGCVIGGEHDVPPDNPDSFRKQQLWQ